MPRFPFNDLGGGINTGQAPASIKDTEFVDLRNFYPFSTKLRRRGGMRRLNDTVHTSRITGIAAYRPATASSATAILGCPTSLAKLVGNAVTTIPAATGLPAITNLNEPWTMFQYKDILYAIRRGSVMLRSDSTYVGRCGIEAPTTAPTIAQGTAGSIPAADFYGVFTYYNENTGVESNPSVASAKLTLGASKKIDWSGITASANTQVTARRLYRTLPNQTGEYYFVGQINDNTTTTFTGDDVLVQDMGEAVSFSNGLPPDDLRFGTVWKERLFASDEVDLLYSEDGQLENFDEDNYIPIFPDDGHVIRAIHAYGDRLVIGKTNKIHYLVGSDPDNFALLTLSDRHGCASHHTMQSAEGLLFWLGFDNVYRSDGNSVTGIASVKLRTIIDSLDPDLLIYATAAVYPELNWYVLAIPGYPELIYNYKTDAWTLVPTRAGITVLGEMFDADYQPVIYAADDAGYVYLFNDTTYGYDDDGATVGGTIQATLTSKPLDAQMPMSKASITRLGLLCAQYSEQVTLSWINESSVIKTRTVSLDYPERWKVYALSTMQGAKAHTRLKLDYSGATAIEIEAYAVDMESLGRFATQPH